MCDNGRVDDAHRTGRAPAASAVRDVPSPCNWDDLRIFLAAVRAGSLAAAARDLRVKHTTVGRRLDTLEADLGVRLFLRDRTGLTLTDAGAEVARRAGAIAEIAVGIARSVAGLDDAVSGTVRLTT